MPICLKPLQKYKGFMLQREISFTHHICAFIGKNGSGKSRLLESIANQSTGVYLNETIITPHQISALQINDIININFEKNARNSDTEHFAQVLLMYIEKHESTENLPNMEMIFTQNGISRIEGKEYKIKEVIIRAENLLQKKGKSLTIDELQLSINIHNELCNAACNESQSLEYNNISQMVTNYYHSIRLNSYLTYLKEKGEDVNHLSESKLFELIGSEDPTKKLNEIIADLFAGKFTITRANPNTAHYTYKAQLILTQSGEEIRLEDLSSGEKSIFWLALKTFEATTFTIDRLFSIKKIVLLDEPDAFLHPQMIIDFFECLYTLHLHLGVIFILTTHSPTTVALIPNDNIFNLELSSDNEHHQANLISKDSAISLLLEGVSQISLSPENTRQVYVENKNDSYIYEIVYTHIKNKSDKIDHKIPLNFISSGPQTSENELRKHIASVYGESDKIQILIEKLTGDGDCSKVIGIVQSLISKGNTTVRGIIDWDCLNRNHPKQVKVFAKEIAYSIENIVYDPISIYAFLCSKGFRNVKDFLDCPDDTHWSETISDVNNLQLIVDKVTQEILERSNNKDHAIEYMGGITLLGDREYFIPPKGENGHDFQKKVIEKFGSIFTINQKSSGRPLIYHFTKEVTIGLLTWRFLNRTYESLFCSLQE